MSTIAITLLFGILASLIANTLSPTFQAAVLATTARVIGWLPLREPANFSGIWSVVWQVDSQRYEPEQQDPSVQLRQLGRRVFASISAKDSHFDVIGVIDGGRYVTGTWRDRIQGGYHGAFQLVVDPSTRSMSGLWIGYSTSDIVKSGRFTWSRSKV